MLKRSDCKIFKQETILLDKCWKYKAIVFIVCVCNIKLMNKYRWNFIFTEQLPSHDWSKHEWRVF